jgi:flavin reductase (DIM6/NTAB) family NADH-FMN oxidoreductase RutF
MKIFSFDEIMSMEQRYRTTFINSIAGFKSLNLVGSIDVSGRTNLAIFNSIFHVGSNPPYLGMVFRPDEVERHTLENILSQKYYTLNHVNPSIVRAAHQTSARYSKNISEFEACGLTPFYSENLIAPYVLESKVKIGLSFKEKLNVESSKTIIIIGQINEIITDERHISIDGFVNLDELKTCTVVGLDAYYTGSKIERLAYAKPDKPTSEII